MRVIELQFSKLLRFRQLRNLEKWILHLRDAGCFVDLSNIQDNPRQIRDLLDIPEKITQIAELEDIISHVRTLNLFRYKVPQGTYSTMMLLVGMVSAFTGAFFSGFCFSALVFGGAAIGGLGFVFHRERKRRQRLESLENKLERLYVSMFACVQALSESNFIFFVPPTLLINAPILLSLSDSIRDAQAAGHLELVQRLQKRLSHVRQVIDGHKKHPPERLEFIALPV